MNPGMQLRLDEKSLNGFKKAMQKFLPHYVNADLNLPTKYHYAIGFFFDFLSMSVDMHDINYETALLDVNDIKFNMTRNKERPLI